MIGVRVSERDAIAIKKAAQRANMTVSEYMRAATLTTMALKGNPHALKMLAAGLGNIVDELLATGSSTKEVAGR
jgi:hypothetical protein